ncbi:MAG: hypothetical protein R6X12_02840 [bacterium]
MFCTEAMACLSRVVLTLAILAGTALADIELADGRLALDALGSANAKWQRTERLGLSAGRFDFYRLRAPVGLIGVVNRTALFRVSFDAGLYEGVYDLHINLGWPNGFGLRAGQFLLPVGLEAMTQPKHVSFVEHSIVRANWRPWSSRDVDIWDPRDVGVMLTFGKEHEGRQFPVSHVEVAVAVVNGSGKGQWLRDDNDWKDVCGRVAVRPMSGVDALIAARGYYGRMGTEGTIFRNSAAEFSVRLGRLRLVGEGQHAVAGTNTRITLYLQGVYSARPWLEPVIRTDASFRPNETDLGLTPGLNVIFGGDRLRLMLNYGYRRRMSSDPGLRLAEQRLLAQLQAWL